MVQSALAGHRVEPAGSSHDGVPMTEQLFLRSPPDLVHSKGGMLQTLLRRLPIETYVIAFTVALWVALSLATPNFLTEFNIANLMRQTPIAAIVAIGVMCTI